MSVSIPEFWNLLLASRLASPNSLPNLQARFSQLKGAEEEGNVATLAQWLITQGVLSRYQAKVLLAGQPGPFIYGDYRVYDRIGSGRLQGAFRALHPASRHRVLLWFHSGPIVANTQWWAVAADQIALVAKVVNPHVARVYQLCDLGQFKFTALEDLQGDSADVRLAAGPIPCAVACRMIRQAALGLARMYELKQLHGSIRPENLWVHTEENVKLLLPPVARDPRIVPGAINLSAANPGDEVQRQSDYLAPEMAQAGQLPSPATDIYALGCTLFHLLAGKPPFAGRDVLSKLASHGSEKIPILDSNRVPTVVSQVLAGMMAKDPTHRYYKPRQVIDALTEVLQKLDPTQLHWPASPISNKLPEYESWLQPYKLAPESKTNWVPEIETPPILAASMHVEEKNPSFDFFPELAPPASPSATTNLVAPSFSGNIGQPLQTGIGIAAAFSPPVLPAPPAIAAGTIPTRAAPPPPRIASTAAPHSAPHGNTSYGIVFPPDESGVIIPFAAAGIRQQKRGQQRMLFSGAVIGMLMMVLLFLWLSMNKKGGESSTAGANAASGTTANEPATEAHAPANEKGEASRPAENNTEVKPPADSKSINTKTDDEGKPIAPPSSGSSSNIPKNATVPISEVKSATQWNNKQLHRSKTKAAIHRFNGITIFARTAKFDADISSQKASFVEVAADESNQADYSHSLDYAQQIDHNKSSAPSSSTQSQTNDSMPKVVADDGQSMWNSPTNGSPINLSYLAPGVQAVLVVRLSDLIAQPNFEKIWPALGPAADTFRRNFELMCGSPLSDIDQLIIGWVDQIDSQSQRVEVPMFVVHFVRPMNPEKLLAQWGYPASMKSSDWMMYQIPQGYSAVLPPKEQGKVLVLGSTEAIQGVIKLAGQAPPLPRPIEKLIRSTDNQRLATFLWISNADLNTAGTSGNPWQTLLSYTQQFFDQTRATAVSAHLSDSNLFLELRVQGPLTRSPAILVRHFKEQMAHLAALTESHIKGLNLDAYDKSLLLRFPQMIQLLSDFTRAGMDGDQIVLRCYLPASAAQNLVAGSQLLLAEGTAASPGEISAIAGQGNQPPQTVAQKLKRVTTLSFARDTLEKSIQMLADDLGIQAEIIGPDLQLEGITKNQSFGLDEKDKPADEILRIIMLKANPDGKLVYVIKPSPSGEETLWITTRQAAAKRGDALPPELAKPTAKK